MSNTTQSVLPEITDRKLTKRNRKKGNGLSYCESLVSINQLPEVVEQLNATGTNCSFAVFMFNTHVINKLECGNSLNLQYAIENLVVGLEWVLLGARNIADKNRLIKFIEKRGYIVTEREMNNVRYLRVEDGDIVKLGLSICTEFYKVDSNADMTLLTDGLDRFNMEISDVMKFVCQSVSQRGFAADVNRTSSILRMIHGKTRFDEDGTALNAFASFETIVGFVTFTDVLNDKLEHSLWSEIQAGPQARKLEDEILGVHGINLLSACGYYRFYSEEKNYDKWFTPLTHRDFKAIAEFCVGILHLLFDHQPGHPLEINFFMPGPDATKLLLGKGLPEPFRNSYDTFMVNFNDAMAQYHEMMSQYHHLMAIESPSPTNADEDELWDTLSKMEKSLVEFPSWLKSLKKLGREYAHYYSCVIDHQTELQESLNDLRSRFSNKVIH
jgi:hypothetical protein